MELSALKSPPVPAVYERDGHKLNMMIAADILTPDFLDAIAEAAKKSVDGEDVGQMRSQINYCVKALVGVIEAWDLTVDSKTQPITEAFLRTLPAQILIELLNTCLTAGIGKDDKKKSEDSILQVDV